MPKLGVAIALVLLESKPNKTIASEQNRGYPITNHQCPIPMTQQETAQLIASLTRQEQLLQQLISVINKPRLGFHNDVGVTRIYCNRSNGCLWYTLANGSTPIAIQQTALSGYLRELKFERVQRRGKEVCKLLITIEADGVYLLESGYDSHFSKCVLSAIASLDLERLKQPVTIAVAPGEDDNVLFARVYMGSEYVKAQYSDNTNFREISKRAIGNVKQANQRKTIK
ncbi:MAG: hypothetical protein WBA39_20915 [Rivularia sp. (in: cyanobacteria)]